MLKCKSFWGACVALAAVLFCTTPAWADCVDTVGLTPQEKDFYQRANAALKSLLRTPPVADKLWSSDSVTDPGQIEVCKSDKKPGNFSVTVSRKYVWPDPKGNMADSVATLSLTINAEKFDLKEPNYSGAFGSPSPSRSAGLKVYNVVWSLTASSYGIAAQTETLRASLADGLERDRMERLVGKPLPPAAESEALGRKAPPTKMLAAAPVTPTSSAANASPTPASAAPANSQSGAAGTISGITGNTSTGAVATQPSAPETPAAPSAVDMVKGLGDSLQKLRGLLGQ